MGPFEIRGTRQKNLDYLGYSLIAIYTQLINKREYPLRAIMDHAG